LSVKTILQAQHITERPHSTSKPRKINRQAESVCTVRRSIVKLKLIQDGIYPYKKNPRRNFPFFSFYAVRQTRSKEGPTAYLSRSNAPAGTSKQRPRATSAAPCTGAAAQKPGRNRPQNCEDEDKNPAQTRHKNDGIRPAGDQNQRNWCEKDLAQPGDGEDQ